MSLTMNNKNEMCFIDVIYCAVFYIIKLKVMNVRELKILLGRGNKLM